MDNSPLFASRAILRSRQVMRSTSEEKETYYARFRRHITRCGESSIDRFRAYSQGASHALPYNARNQTSSIITTPSKCNGGLCYSSISLFSFYLLRLRARARYRIVMRWRRIASRKNSDDVWLQRSKFYCQRDNAVSIEDANLQRDENTWHLQSTCVTSSICLYKLRWVNLQLFGMINSLCSTRLQEN